MYRNSLMFLLALGLFALAARLWASVIYVSGDQTGTWSADTVIVTGEVRVPPGQSLTILPGVEVLFSVYCKLIVDNGATLRAIGTEADSIHFCEYIPGNLWKGIRFLSASSNSRLEYCHLTSGWASGSGEDAKGGAIYCSSSCPTIQNCLINSCSANEAGGGISCYNNSNPTIRNNVINGNSTNLGGGIYCAINSIPTISNNIINGNSAYYYGGGIYCTNSSASISENVISVNFAYTGGGIYCTSSNPIISSNTLSGNAAASGGGIACDYSSPIISGNTLIENSAFWDGGGIVCISSNPTISSNTITGNSATSGGGILCTISNPTIISNNFSGNSATSGGGIRCTNSNPTIRCNTFSGNSASYGGGGGINCYDSCPIISGNTLSGNSADNTYGGGIYCLSSCPIISSNTLSRNSAGSGGGISCLSSSPIINGNTISGNSATSGPGYGGGIGCFTNSSPMLANCILWGNRPQQIYVQTGSPEVSYSDIQDGYPGTGNINAYPAFVDTAQHDYRLQWGSPCIDTGDPSPFYNDPDSTRADMGAFYYDQSMPVRILLTPYHAPIQIPVSEGSFQYALHLTNIATTTLPVLGWCNVTLPSGSTYGPVLGPLNVNVDAGLTLSRLRTQTVPASAPAGIYHYNAFAMAAGDTSQDSFTFVKLGSGIQGSVRKDSYGGFGGWTNTGEEFGEAEKPLIAHNSALITSLTPNPFNANTVASFKLQAPSYVNLKVYDTTGRLVTTLVDGWRDAGSHEVTFAGSRLASGVYFYTLTAGGNTMTGKIVLLK